MTRRARVVWISGSAVALLLLLAGLVGVMVTRSGWLLESFRRRIVAEAETATGGRIEIGGFKLDWRSLTAELENVTIHGTESAGEAPLLAVKRLLIGFRIVSLLQRELDISRVAAESPQAHIVFHPDGSTNIPKPRVTGKRTAPETILDLKIGTFKVTNGIVVAEQRGSGKRVTPWNASGQKLAVRASYSTALSRYDATVDIEPVHLGWNGLAPVDFQFHADASMERNRVLVSRAALKMTQSEVDFRNAVVDGFTSPVATAEYSASVSLADADRIFKLVNFRHEGTVNVTGAIRYVSSADFHLSGAFRGAGIGYGKVRGIRVAGNIAGDPDSILLNGVHLSALGGEIFANGQVRALREFHLAGRLEHFGAGMLTELAGLPKLPYDGIVSGPFDATGKVAEASYHHIIAGASLTVLPAQSGVPVNGVVAAKYDAAAGTLELGPSWLQLPSSRLDVAGVPGQRLTVRLESRDLNDVLPVLNGRKIPFALRNGSVAVNGVLAGPIGDPQVTGHAEIRNAVYQSQLVDSLSGDFTAGRTEAAFSNTAVVVGTLHARLDGSIGLRDWQPVETSPLKAILRITNADMPKLLALAGQRNVPLSGTLTATSQVSGTLGDPHVNAESVIVKGQVYGEPFDSLAGHAEYVRGGEQVLTAALGAGRKRVNVTARFEHAPSSLFEGRLLLNVSSNAMPLNQIAWIRKEEPQLSGTAQVKADAVVQINRSRFQLTALNADANAAGLSLESRILGNVHLTAVTENGILTARMDSTAVQASIHGEGTVTLAGAYPVNARVSFSDLGLGAAAALIRGRATPGQTRDFNFDGSAAGEMTISGPAKTPDLIAASIDISRFELHPLVAGNVPNLALRNSGPLRATLSKSVIRVESARFQAPETDLNLSGNIALADETPLNLRVQGKVNLALAEAYNADLMSSGELNINTAVRGTYLDPDIAGRAELRKGDFHYADFANGFTNANGVILFSGTRATIESLSAESGGGKVEASGFATLNAGVVAFRLEAKAVGVRVRYPEGVSSVSDSDLTFAGTTQRSEASGTVTLRRIAINPKSDISTILASAAQPIRTPESRVGLLANMNMDVQVETAPDVTFQTSVAQSLQADANLRVRGTAANPAVLGRINITQGELVFFGNKYTINQGSVSFFNAAKIDPILNVDLETKARGVQVTLTFTGPVNNLNLSFRSDPPLQFADIVALLATGRSPTDPTLAIRNTGQSQSLQQIGASALIGQAIANPVAGRLQRFFGVSKIKIDPQLTGITGSPEARLTIEQQVTPELLFTYISDVSSTSTQLIRVEWDFNRRWSAILTREENGYVGIDFAFKKRFR